MCISADILPKRSLLIIAKAPLSTEPELPYFLSPVQLQASCIPLEEMFASHQPSELLLQLEYHLQQPPVHSRGCQCLEELQMREMQYDGAESFCRDWNKKMLV